VTIELVGLVVFGHHGYVEVDVDDVATTSDRIEDTVDYRRIAHVVREVFTGEERLLLEALAGATADKILERFAEVRGARVRVRKPDVVLEPPVDHAAVVVERSRSA
jgi:dihydroneopterin aldolase